MRRTWTWTQQGHGVEHPDRHALERAGWRTLLDYRENHVRDDRGRLVGVEARWTAEAERCRGRVRVASVTAPTQDDAWVQLRSLVRNSIGDSNRP